MGIQKALKNLLAPKKRSGLSAIVAMVAIVLGLLALAVVLPLILDIAGKGIGKTSTETECESERVAYCTTLLHGLWAPKWKESCGDPPTPEECESRTGEPIKCDPGDTVSCKKYCKACVGDVCDSRGKSTSGVRTCLADKTWGECDAPVCEDECADKADCAKPCENSGDCEGKESSCECISEKCIDCSNYYGTDCEDGGCADTEKPVWECVDVGGDMTCVATCEEKTECIPTYTCEESPDQYCRDVCNPGEFDGIGTCPEGLTCCLEPPPGPG